MTDVPFDEGHAHRLPKSLLPIFLICVFGLVISVILTAVQAVQAAHRAQETNARLTALEEHVAARGQQRDAETEAQRQQFGLFVCQVLDQLPAAPTLDRLRATYQCGPGLDPGAIPTN